MIFFGGVWSAGGGGGGGRGDEDVERRDIERQEESLERKESRNIYDLHGESCEVFLFLYFFIIFFAMKKRGGGAGLRRILENE